MDKEKILLLLLKLIKEDDSMTRAVMVKMIIEELDKIK